MERKHLLAIVLSMFILFVYYGFYYKAPNKPAPAPVVATSPVPAAANPAVPVTPTVPVRTDTPPETKNELQNSLVEAEFTSKTGLPEHWQLKNFSETIDKKGPRNDLLKSPDLNNFQVLLFPENRSVESAELEPAYVAPTANGLTLRYSQGRIGDLVLEQTATLSEKNYAVDVNLKIQNQGQAPQNIAPGLRILLPQKEEQKKGFLGIGAPTNFIHPVYRLGSKTHRERDVHKLPTLTEKVGDVSWVGLEDRYFLRAVLARSLSSQNKANFGVSGNKVYSDFQYPNEILSPGIQKEYNFTVYLGPKNVTFLKAYESNQLEEAIDYGWFAFAARPIFAMLKFFQSFLKNWGLAIILLTVVIKLALHPLTRKSMQSMKAMQALQPQMQQIREKYKNDRERLNLETMNLFRTHKVNPMGGCLPILIQMPIYIALYNVLNSATELYHAPFFGFYRDLSAPDPYFILPIVLGLFMVLQQKMTPNPSADPTQAKVMMVMPVLFTVFMLFLPVGLVLYILVNTVMTVIQQYWNQRDVVKLHT